MSFFLINYIVIFRTPAESLVMRKGKRWPQPSRRNKELQTPRKMWDDMSYSSNPLRNRRSISNMDVFSITQMNHDVKKISEVNLNVDSDSHSNSFNDILNQIPPNRNQEYKKNSHHKKYKKQRIILNDQPIFADNPELISMRNHSKEFIVETNFQDYDSSSTHTPNMDNRDDKNPSNKQPISGKIDLDIPLIPKSPCHQDSFDDNNKTCTERYHFPSAVLMIEAHYNQTVRDFLQICTPIERVEIDSLNDVQVLLNVIYQQMSLIDKGISDPSSVILLFNLENYSNWTKERVINVLQTTVNVLFNDFSDMMIYSKFHQDGSDSNEIRLLQLVYDVKYWLSDLCNQRLIPCADFSSIILESVLHMNELSENSDSFTTHSSLSGSSDATSTQANTYNFSFKVYLALDN